MSARSSVVTGLALVLACGLAACMQDDAETDELAADSAAMMPDTAAAQGTLTDGQILQLVMTVNTADSSGGAMAQTMATDAAVKAFAQRMVQDHGAANQQLQQLTQSGVTPEPSDQSRQLEQQHQQASQQMHSMSGAQHDAAYIQHEVQMHQTALDLLDQQLIPNAQNAQLKQALQQIRTSVQSHLEQAQQIQGQLGGAGGQPGAPPTTTGL